MKVSSMIPTDIKPTGFTLPNGCRIAHGTSANIKTPFTNIPLQMHELYPGGRLATPVAQRGQFGFIHFNQELRLPRHVHVTMAERDGDRRLLAERILVTGGVGLVELNGDVFIIPDGALVDIPAGVPHTWTACPSGIAMPDGTMSSGTFLMIYDYAEPTDFFPVEETQTLASTDDFRRFQGNIEKICFPRLTTNDVLSGAYLIWDDGLMRPGKHFY